MKYICKISSTTGRKGAVVDLNPHEKRTADLLARGIIALFNAFRPAEPQAADYAPQPVKRRKRKTKGGATPEDAGLTDTEAKVDEDATA